MVESLPLEMPRPLVDMAASAVVVFGHGWIR